MIDQMALLEITPTEVVALPAPLPIPRTIWLVVAYRYTEYGGYWKVHREINDHEYRSLEDAQRAAKSLAPHWTHRQLVRLDLGQPAEGKNG